MGKTTWETHFDGPDYRPYMVKIREVSHVDVLRMSEWSGREFGRCAQDEAVNTRWGYWYDGAGSLDMWFIHLTDITMFKLQFCGSF